MTSMKTAFSLPMRSLAGPACAGAAPHNRAAITNAGHASLPANRSMPDPPLVLARRARPLTCGPQDRQIGAQNWESVHPVSALTGAGADMFAARANV